MSAINDALKIFLYDESFKNKNVKNSRIIFVLASLEKQNVEFISVKLSYTLLPVNNNYLSFSNNSDSARRLES